MTTVDNKSTLSKAFIGRVPVVTGFSVYTYDGHCAGWKFTYQDGSEYKHYKFSDDLIGSTVTETANVIGTHKFITGMNAYVSIQTASGTVSTAYEFITTDSTIMCGT